MSSSTHIAFINMMLVIFPCICSRAGLAHLLIVSCILCRALALYYSSATASAACLEVVFIPVPAHTMAVRTCVLHDIPPLIQSIHSPAAALAHSVAAFFMLVVCALGAYILVHDRQYTPGQASRGQDAGVDMPGMVR
jgi:hypothetical protein